ncbi:MAG: type II secretion system F family protein [Deltaproteobacteria bacterium]|nr:type II secretion system F family protein [Deltaproteobacteria bacterium]
MPMFVWEGTLRSGELRKGVMDAASVAAVEQKLRAQQITVKSVKRDWRNIQIKMPGSTGVKLQDLVQFTRQFATMIDAGLPLVQALDILAGQQENPAFKVVLHDVKTNVESGKTFADSLAKHPRVFDSLFVNLVSAGETGGVLDTIMNRLSLYLEKNARVIRQVKGAMVYPLVVLSVGIVIAIGMLIWVIPVFQDMFADFNAALPAPTQFIVDLSQGLRHNWFIFVIFVIGIYVGWIFIRRNKQGHEITDRIFLQLPVFGPVLRKVAVARFTRTMSTMLSSGVPILDALDIVARSAGNVVVEKALYYARQKISEGRTLAEPLAETKVFPGMVVQMISVGEATGAMDAMLSKIADFYDEEVDVAIATLTSMLEPVIMMVLAVLLGGLIIGMYLPIFSLAGAISTEG